jgi:hypothetical protein
MIFLLFFLSRPLFSQDSTFIEKINVPTFIDTLFIDRDLNNWSIRLFTNYKFNKFKISNSDQYVLFTPNNPWRYGVGVATRKFVLDIALNIKPKGEEPTKRIDLLATILLKNHQIDYFFQRYQGYNADNGMTEEFRPDLTTFSSGLRYLYMFNADEYSMAARRTGLARQKKAAFTSGLGGFLFLNRIKVDSSIVPQEIEPPFNEEAGIVNLYGVGAGVLANFSATVPFWENFFVSASITPGIGLVWKYVESESVSYHPENPLLYQVDLGGIVGYHGDRFYTNLSLGYALNATNLDFGNKIVYSRANTKLAVGYKLGNK